MQSSCNLNNPLSKMNECLHVKRDMQTKAAVARSESCRLMVTLGNDSSSTLLHLNPEDKV